MSSDLSLRYIWFSGVNFTENRAADYWNQAWLSNVSDEVGLLCVSSPTVTNNRI